MRSSRKRQNKDKHLPNSQSFHSISNFVPQTPLMRTNSSSPIIEYKSVQSMRYPVSRPPKVNHKSSPSLGVTPTEGDMKSTSEGLLVLGLFALATAFPASIGENPEQGEKFEGDILLSPEQRNGLLAEKYRWSEGKVFYNIHEAHFDAEHINHIHLALQQLEDVSCIRFYPADGMKTGFINITGAAGGCYSNVGYQGRVQVVNFQVYALDTGCFRVATMCHELLHALGFYHQQAATDRDEFVKILYENIQDGLEYNFNTYSSSVVGDFGVQYDYGSVMHYGPKAFSKNGEPTIVPLDPTAVIGQRDAISPKDVAKLNLMYNCPGYV